MTAEEKLAEFKRLSADRKSHPDAVQAAWEEFIETARKEKDLKDGLITPDRSIA